MSIKDTYKNLKDLLISITSDLEKSENGNKAASQRVRTGTVKLEKLAKQFRKESISHEKKTKGNKKSTKSAAKKPAQASTKTASKPTASKAKSAASSNGSSAAKTKAAGVKEKPKAKTSQAKTTIRSPQLLVKKRATAKLPTKRHGHR